jgi:phosphate transport system substrate-binding protein
MRHIAILGMLFLVACGGGGRTLIQNKGSDTLVNLAQAWAEAYHAAHPDVGIAVSGGGSGTGIAALINGTVDIANCSREMKPEEIEAARRNTGKTPIRHVVAYDALAVYVNPANPLESITREQLACIFGEDGECDTWDDLGVEAPGCSGQEIVRVSRQNNSGTYVYFREWVLGPGRDFKLGSRDMQGSKDVVDLVASTPCAIGYSGLGYKTDRVKTLCIQPEGGGDCVAPSIAAAADGSYPLARPLYMYTLGEPAGAVAAYLDWVRSPEGQALVERAGYAPLPASRP